LTSFCIPAVCQDLQTEVGGIPINEDESKVPDYSLPEPMILNNGKSTVDPKSAIQIKKLGNT